MEPDEIRRRALRCTRRGVACGISSEGFRGATLRTLSSNRCYRAATTLGVSAKAGAEGGRSTLQAPAVGLYDRAEATLGMFSGG